MSTRRIPSVQFGVVPATVTVSVAVVPTALSLSGTDQEYPTRAIGDPGILNFVGVVSPLETIALIIDRQSPSLPYIRKTGFDTESLLHFVILSVKDLV